MPSTVYGYAYLPNDMSDANLESIVLKEFGCDLIIIDLVRTDNHRERKGINRILNSIGREDTLVINKIDYLASSIEDLLYITTRLTSAGANLVQLRDKWASPSVEGGPSMFDVLQWYCAYNYDYRQRQESSVVELRKLTRARRLRNLSKDELFSGRQMVLSGVTIRKAAQRIGCSYTTLQRALDSLHDEAGITS
jgi:DNA invertase Pin-like site-specific DNA recombinase